MKTLKYIFQIGFAILVLIVQQSCSTTKRLPEGAYLLNANKINIVGYKKIEERQKLKEEVKKIAIQKPNKRAFGLFPIKLWLYSAANKPKENKFNWWIKNKVGEAPVILDTTLATKSDKALANYMQNSGFFNAKVTHEVLYKKRKAVVAYTITPGEAWKISTVMYPRPTYKTDSIVWQNHAKSVLKSGQRFDVVKLKAERERIETELQNSGFYFFTKDYVTFDLDTSTYKREVKINVIVSQQSDSVEHLQYWMNNIYSITDFGMGDANNRMIKRDTLQKKEFFYIRKKDLVRPKVIRDGIFFEKNQLFQKENYLLTLGRLSNYGVYKFVSVEFEPKDTPSQFLDAILRLTPAKRQSLGLDGQVNYNTEGFFGVSGGVNYRNRNLTKNADLLAIDLTTGFQFQVATKQPAAIITTQVGATITYSVNRILFPLINNSVRFKRPKTKFKINYNFEQRFDFTDSNQRAFLYDLHNFGFSIGYEWEPNRFMHHYINPLTFSLFLFPKTGDEFNKRLNENASLRNTYQERIILGPSYTFEYTSQTSLTDNKYIYNRSNIETSGNLLMAGFALANINKGNKPPFKIADREFAQYMRVENDFRGFYRFHPNFSFAGRSFIGLALPYGNSTTIPFVKQFFTGGPNSLRGFRVREVGPGSYSEPTFTSGERRFGFFNQTGDIKIELNAELRIDVYKWLKTAVFLDVGNVWLLNNDPQRPNANFALNRFWNEFAMNFGAGVRLDFSYFVIRLDYGVPIRDPRIHSDNKWFIKAGQFQLGVGYPF